VSSVTLSVSTCAAIGIRIVIVKPINKNTVTQMNQVCVPYTVGINISMAAIILIIIQIQCHVAKRKASISDLL